MLQQDVFLKKNDNNNFEEFRTYRKELMGKDNSDFEMAHDQFNASLEIRLGFIKKVFGILTIQMVFTTLLCLISISSISFNEFQRSHPEIVILCLLASLVTLLLLCCVRSVSRTVPTNYVVLSIFTVGEAYTVSFICGATTPSLVAMASAMTCTLTIALSLYACKTDKDFTIMNSKLFICFIIMILFAIFVIFTQIKILHVILSCLWVLLYSFYMIYDIQMILGNKKNAMEIDDYIFASAMLYLDVINILLNILNLIRYIK